MLTIGHEIQLTIIIMMVTNYLEKRDRKPTDVFRDDPRKREMVE